MTWFAVIEFQRIAKGLPMTTLELTTLSFVPVLLATTLLWYHKPSITTPSIIRTKGDKTIERIRQDAKDAVSCSALVPCDRPRTSSPAY